MSDLVHRLFDRAYGGMGLDLLCEEAALEIKRLREEREDASRRARLALPDAPRPKPNSPDPAWLIYALGLVMAGATYFLIWFFTYWGRR